MTVRPLPFANLTPGEDDAAVRAAIARVIDRGWFVLGPELEAFETEFAVASGAAGELAALWRAAVGDRGRLAGADLPSGDLQLAGG